MKANLVDWIRAGTGETVRREPDCPDENRLASFVDGRMAPADRGHLQDHLADCDHCLRAVAFLSRMAEAGHPESVPVALRAAHRENRFWSAPATSAKVAWRWAAAATLVAVTSVAVWRLEPEIGGGSDSDFRSPESGPSSSLLPGPANRGPQVLFPSAGATMPSGGADFHWTQVQAAVSYSVRVVTLDGDIVWEERVFGAEASLPPKVRLSPGETYFVRISAHLAGGKTLDSEHVRFFVAGSP